MTHKYSKKNKNEAYPSINFNILAIISTHLQN
jgi:hypothetical protein